MAGKRDIKAGGAFVELFLKDGRFHKGLMAAQRRLHSFGQGVMRFGGMIAGLGAAILGPLVAALKHFTSAGDALGKMSARTGVAASALAEFGFAAEQGGSSLEDVEKGIKRMQRTIVDADMGMKSAADALGAMGLSAGKLKGMKPEDQFQAIADALASIEDPTKRAALAQMVLGRAGTQLLPMLSTLREVRAEAQARGLVPSDEAVKDAEAINDAFNRIRRTALSVAFEIGAALAPVLLPALEVVAKIGTATIAWVKENGQLIRTIAMIGAGLLVAGGIITGLGLAIFGVGTAFGALAGVISGIAAVVALLLSPVGLVVAGIVAATVAWVKFTESGQAAFGVFKNIIGDIGTRLLKGDLQGAWDTVVMGMAAVWDTFAANMVSVFKNAVDMIKGLWNQVAAVAQTALMGLEMAARASGQDKLARAIGAARSGMSAVKIGGNAALGSVGSAAGAVESAMRNRADKSMAEFEDRIAGGGERFGEEIKAIIDEISGLFGDLSAMDSFGGGLEGFDMEGMAKAAAATVTFSGSGLLASGQGGGPGDALLREAKDHKKLTGEGNKKLDKLIEKIGMAFT